VQRAYFSAWRMVFEVPSVKSAGMRTLPCGVLTGGSVVRSYSADARALLEKWQQVECVRAKRTLHEDWKIPNARRQMAKRVVIVVRGHAELPQVAGALGAPCSLAGRLNSWQQQSDQDA